MTEPLWHVVVLGMTVGMLTGSVLVEGTTVTGTTEVETGSVVTGTFVVAVLVDTASLSLDVTASDVTGALVVDASVATAVEPSLGAVVVGDVTGALVGGAITDVIVSIGVTGGKTGPLVTEGTVTTPDDDAGVVTLLGTPVITGTVPDVDVVTAADWLVVEPAVGTLVASVLVCSETEIVGVAVDVAVLVTGSEVLGITVVDAPAELIALLGVTSVGPCEVSEVLTCDVGTALEELAALLDSTGDTSDVLGAVTDDGGADADVEVTADDDVGTSSEPDELDAVAAVVAVVADEIAPVAEVAGTTRVEVEAPLFTGGFSLPRPGAGLLGTNGLSTIAQFDAVATMGAGFAMEMGCETAPCPAGATGSLETGAPTTGRSDFPPLDALSPSK